MNWQMLEGNGVQAYCAWQERRQERISRLEVWRKKAHAALRDALASHFLVVDVATSAPGMRLTARTAGTEPPPKPAPLFELSI